MCTYGIDMMSSTWIPDYVYITVHDISEKKNWEEKMCENIIKTSQPSQTMCI